MKRVSRACQQCRSKHIKCNGRSPCSRCIAHAELHNISPEEICLYPEPKKRGRPSANSTSASSSSVGKKKIREITKGRSSTPTANLNRASNLNNNRLNMANITNQHRWQKNGIPSTDPLALFNFDSLQTSITTPLSQSSMTANPNQLADRNLWTQYFNLNFLNNEYIFYGQPLQQQQALSSINASSPTTLSPVIYRSNLSEGTVSDIDSPYNSSSPDVLPVSFSNTPTPVANSPSTDYLYPYSQYGILNSGSNNPSQSEFSMHVPFCDIPFSPYNIDKFYDQPINNGVWLY